MAEHTTLYSLNPAKLDLGLLSQLADDGVVTPTDTGALVTWPDVVLQVHTLPEDDLEEHLQGFGGFVVARNGNQTDGIEEMLNLIANVRQVFGFVPQPGFDAELKVKSLIVSLAASLETCLIFHDSMIYSPLGQLWFGPSDAGDYADSERINIRRVSAPVVATEAQQHRAEQTNRVLENYGVPVFEGPLQWIPDVEAAVTQDASDVALRVVAMHATVCAARGRERPEVLAALQAGGIDEYLSPGELAFLQADSVEDGDREGLVWRLEGLKALMWALGFVDELDWPHEQCQADRLHELIFDACENTASFIGSARLRPLDELLDALELSTRQHWAIRDAHRRQAAVPANFDWNQPGDMVPAVECPVFGVIAERHYALNWLMRFRNAQWDTVDTPT